MIVTAVREISGRWYEIDTLSETGDITDVREIPDPEYSDEVAEKQMNWSWLALALLGLIIFGGLKRR